LIKRSIHLSKKLFSLLPDNQKKKYNRVLDLLSFSELEYYETPTLETGLKRARETTDPKERLSAARKLVRQYPNHPLSHLELAQCLHKASDPHEFEQMDRYGEVRREWLKSTGYGELGLEFILSGIFLGSFGNPFSIEMVLKANQLGLRTAKKLVLLLSQNHQLRNPALFSYFEPYICVIRDRETISNLKRLEELLALPLGWCIPMNEGCPFINLAANRIEEERTKQGSDSPFFTLSSRHEEMGVQALGKLGLPKDSWYVTLHVREPGYRGETHANTTENWRNANPIDYLKAIEGVTNAGGWVFRMGDPSMTPLPSMPQVIDYAHHVIRCDWMDVFLGATCQFCIGTGSGYFHIPQFFDRPLLFTNYPASSQYFTLRQHDIYLPRLLRRRSNGEYLTFEQYMSPPISNFWSMKNFRDADLDWVENTPEDLEAATKEMIERTTERMPQKTPDNDLQLRFKATAKVCGQKYHGRPITPFAPISSDFLAQHAHLLGRGETL